MPQGAIDNTFNGLATKREFPVKEVLARLIEIRDQSIENLKRSTGEFEAGLTKSDEGNGNVSHLHDQGSRRIQDSISDIAYSAERLSLRQAAVDALVRFKPEEQTLELDFTKDLAEEVIREIHKQAKENSKESDVMFTVPLNVRTKLAL